MKAKYGVPLIFLLMLFFEPFRLVAYGDTDKLSFPFNPSHLSAQSNSFPCVIVNQAHIEGVEQFNRIKPKLVREWKQLIEGQCVSDSILIGYAERVNSDLAQEGYITSYLFYPKQNFLFGILKARLLAGELSNIRYEGGSSDHISLSNAFPQIAGQAFNLRQVEQGLFNLQNTSLIPYQISLIRDDDGGGNNTQLVVERKVKRAVKGLLSLESQASSGQPTHIVSHTLLSANPFLLNDLLYVDMKNDLGIEPNKKLKSAAFFYSLPYQYWLFSTYAGYQESQEVKPIYDIDLLMQQRSKVLLLQAQYMLYRMQNSLTYLNVGTQTQVVDTFLSDRRLMTQRRLANYFLVGLTYQRDYSQGSLALSLNYQRGIDWFGTNTRQITGLDISQIYQLSIDAQRAFLWRNQPMYHQHQLDIQLSRSKLDNLLEQSAFNGKLGLSGFVNGSSDFNMGDNSITLKNEVGWFTPWKEIQLYSSLDLGATSNDRATFWKENSLVGTRIGVRGNLGALAYHFFMETPLWYATSSQPSQLSSGISLRFDY